MCSRRAYGIYVSHLSNTREETWAKPDHQTSLGISMKKLWRSYLSCFIFAVLLHSLKHSHSFQNLPLRPVPAKNRQHHYTLNSVWVCMLHKNWTNKTSCMGQHTRSGNSRDAMTAIWNLPSYGKICIKPYRKTGPADSLQPWSQSQFDNIVNTWPLRCFVQIHLDSNSMPPSLFQNKTNSMCWHW